MCICPSVICLYLNYAVEISIMMLKAMYVKNAQSRLLINESESIDNFPIKNYFFRFLVLSKNMLNFPCCIYSRNKDIKIYKKIWKIQII